MNEIERLVQAYERFCKLPWDKSLAGPQKVWFAIYDPAQERRLRLHVPDFETATISAGHAWHLVDITDSFARWMARHEYHELYFEEPDAMALALGDYAKDLATEVETALKAPEIGEDTVVAILGVGSLFGLTRCSTLLDAISSAIPGRLLVFFPGQHERSNYRLLDARDGWNYLAVAITATDEV